MKTLKSILLLGLFCMISLGASAEILLGDANNDGTVNETTFPPLQHTFLTALLNHSCLQMPMQTKTVQ